MNRTRVSRALGLSFLVLAVGSGAWFAPEQAAAQVPGTSSKAPVKLDPPVPQAPTKSPSFLLGIGVALVLGMATIGATMIPSKRGHQD